MTVEEDGPSSACGMGGLAEEALKGWKGEGWEKFWSVSRGYRSLKQMENENSGAVKPGLPEK